MHDILIILVLVLTCEMTQMTDLIDKRIERESIHSYCRSFRSCNDCKKAAIQCEWCHDFGCTSHARYHCPKKMFLDNIWRKNHARFCTEIVTKSPLFVPAGIRQFIKLDMRVDDMTIYERNIICEINVEQRVYQVQGAIDQNYVLCEIAILKINQNVVIGGLTLLWGGAEPYSNSVLLVVYQCNKMAHNCQDCHNLNAEFNCGWCKETRRCSLEDECPRQFGPWINRNFTCDRGRQQLHDRSIISYQPMKRYWLRI